METIHHPTVEDVLDVHDVVVEEDDGTSPGVLNVGDVEYTTEFVSGGHFGSGPETIHGKAYHLLRLLVANHPFVDGNKRTALATTVLFYSQNDLDFAYDREIKDILKAFGTSANDVDESYVLDYLDRHTSPQDTESATTIDWGLEE